MRRDALWNLLTGSDPGGWADTVQAVHELRDLAGHWHPDTIDQALADNAAAGRLRFTFTPEGDTVLHLLGRERAA